MLSVPYRALMSTLLAGALAATLTACGGGGGGSSPAPAPVPLPVATYVLGGSVSGLADGATVTVTSGSDSLNVAANGSFVLPTRLAGGTAYSVSSSTPAGHTCSVTDGAGTVGTADVSKVAVKCTAFLLAGKRREVKNAFTAAADATGVTYVIDDADNVILRVAVDGAVSVFAGIRNVRGHQDGPGATATFNTSLYSRLAFDGQGNLLLTDTCNGLVRKITPAAVVSTVAGKYVENCGYGIGPVVDLIDGPVAVATLELPSAIAVEPGGAIVVASMVSRGIRRISTAGMVSSEDPLSTFGSLSISISALAFAQDGTLYIAQAGTSSQRRLWRVEAGKAVLVAGGVFGTPIATDTPALGAAISGIASMAFDKTGNLYLADFATVRRLSTAGILSTIAGSATVPSASAVDGTGANARFTKIAALTINGEGNIVVLESAASQLRTMTPAGVVTTFAATPVGLEYANGKGAAARFFTDRYLASAPDGMLYSADTDKHVVRKIAADGTVSLFAGIAGVSGQIFAPADGPVASATLTKPVAVTVDRAGVVYVLDANGVRKISGGVVATIPNTYQYGSLGNTLRVMPDGAIAIGGGTGVVILAPDGTVRRQIQAGPNLPDYQLMWVQGIEVDATGNLYIVDAANAVVLKFGTDLNLSVFAGTVGAVRNADGPAGTGAIKFDNGGDIAIDSAGNLYLSGQGAIRKVSAQGVLSTLDLAWGRPYIYGIAVANGKLYGSSAFTILQTPLP